MSDDEHRPPGQPPPFHRPGAAPPAPPVAAAPAPPAGEGATQLFNLKLDSWLTDFVADLHAPAGAPPMALEGTPLAPAAPPAPDPYGAPSPAPAPAPMPMAAPYPAAPDPAASMGSPRRHGSSPDAFGGPSPLAAPGYAPQGLAPQGPDPYQAPPPEPLAGLAAAGPPGAHVASAVPPIPAFAASAVPPIPGLAGGAPRFEEAPRRWPIVLALMLLLLAGAGGAVWSLFGERLRALLHP